MLQEIRELPAPLGVARIRRGVDVGVRSQPDCHMAVVGFRPVPQRHLGAGGRGRHADGGQAVRARTEVAKYGLPGGGAAGARLPVRDWALPEPELLRRDSLQRLQCVFLRLLA